MEAHGEKMVFKVFLLMPGGRLPTNTVLASASAISASPLDS